MGDSRGRPRSWTANRLKEVGSVRFGAKTSGTLVILGTLVLAVGLFFADSVRTLFRLFPPGLLRVILLFGGLELAAGVR